MYVEMCAKLNMNLYESCMLECPGLIGLLILHKCLSQKNYCIVQYCSYFNVVSALSSQQYSNN